MRILAFLIATSAWGQITSIPGLVNPSGGAIGGASAVATGQVLYGTGAGVAGSNANLFWDNANGRLGVGINAPVRPLHVRGAGGMRVDVAASGFEFSNTDTGVWQILPVNSLLRFGINGAMFFPNGSQSVLLGTTTDDGTNRLQVAGSIRAHDLNILDPTATIGATLVNIGTDGSSTSATTTQLVVRAGTVQGSTNLQTWQNAAGSQVAAMSAAGDASYRQWIGAPISFASLGTPANGTFVYCDNCTIANPCASGGTGAFAKRLNSVWVCN